MADTPPPKADPQDPNIEAGYRGQEYGIDADEPHPQPSELVKEHEAYVKKLGHRTAPETDLGEPAEETPDPPERV
ncbi:hypothetical protein [Phenylobacterium sp.]|uniref:hypothetical protein n=1 Tax=Phenylobacterium sp. TaxID=1871053 RepID=UPI0008B6344F|nr:hypothetical protein [Phenylobacterium sp.]MBA4792483.1 hypothetical protein [Phenylobacterium sp.]MBC7167184.1 hypothetical protein [Phenylobacterium sp.]OHB36488.1 MAG: hypothetical protein A2882_01655 [Phenylobacterium sp. RIFCSPHIGHO2_01_FULL_70_10]